MTEFRDTWLHAHNMIHSARQIINENLKPLNLSSTEGNILLHLLKQGEEMGQEQLVEQKDHRCHRRGERHEAGNRPLAELATHPQPIPYRGVP